MFATKSSTLFVLLILVIAHLGLTSAQSTISWGEPFTVDYTTGTAVNTPSTAPEPSLLSPSPSKPLSTQTSSSVGRSPSPSIPASSSPISSSEPPRSSISVLVTDSVRGFALLVLVLLVLKSLTTFPSFQNKAIYTNSLLVSESYPSRRRFSYFFIYRFGS